MIFLIISLITFYIYLILKSKKAVNILEKNNYNLKNYFKCIFKKGLFLNFELCFIILILIAICTNSKTTGICTILFYMFLSLKELKEKIKVKDKKMLFLTIVLFISLTVPIILDYESLSKMYLFYDPTFIYYFLLFLFMYLIWFIIPVSLFIKKLYGGKNVKN